jgi:hypothetical protein
MSSSVSGGATITPNTLNAITEVLASSAMAASGINLSQPHPVPVLHLLYKLLDTKRAHIRTAISTVGWGKICVP